MSVYPATTENSKITVAVGMSGGVDSSVSAALLKEQGYSVVGFFMKNWGDTAGLKSSECPWLADREDAMRSAAKLDIPFHTLDFEEEYKDAVLEYFFSEYQAGRTPNPDVLCNSEIKFGVFLEKALSLGADYIATGHYARLSCHSRESGNLGAIAPNANVSLDPRSPIGVEDKFRGGDKEGCRLLKAKDQNKDQTYFLYRLNQKQLSRALFPVGEYAKPEVREMAKKFGLANHDKHDSQGVCFIGHIDLRKFLSQKIQEKPGDIVTVAGKKVGEHQGLFWYTIGQRKGINIGGIGPFYVAEKNVKANQLIVTNNSKDERLYKREVVIGDVHWIYGEALAGSFACEGRIRYREPLSPCTVEAMDEGRYRVTFEKPQWAVASGQSLVLYQGEECLGGGIIESA